MRESRREDYSNKGDTPMKVDINHREETSGWLSKKTYYVVDLTVTFSEEELAIIKQRKLEGDIVIERGIPANQDPGKFKNIEDVFNLSIGKLTRGTDSYAFSSPRDAKEYEAEIHDIMPKLKQHIMDNAEIEEKSTSFEL